MIAALSQKITRLSFKNSPSLGKFDAVFSLPLHHYSTPGKREAVISVFEFLVHKHHFSPKSALQIASEVTLLRNPEKSDSILSFLKESGFSVSQLERTFECKPQLLSADLEKCFKPKTRIFQEFGISAKDAAEIIANDPWIFKQSLNEKLIPSLSVLKNLLGSSDLTKLLKVSGWFLKTHLHSSLVPNVELLKNCGVSMAQIIWLMFKFPRFMLRKPEDMKRFVDKVDGMGVGRSSKMFIHALRMLGSLSDETWEHKLRAFREIGFSDDDTVAAFRKSPLVFGLSEERLKEAKEVLLANGKYDLSCIISHPISLMYSIEKRHRLRLQVLEVLEGRNLIQSWPTFSRFFGMSNQAFYEKYVAPYLDELGDVYKAKRTTSS